MDGSWTTPAVVTLVCWDLKRRQTPSLETLWTTWNISWIAFHAFERWRNLVNCVLILIHTDMVKETICTCTIKRSRTEILEKSNDLSSPVYNVLAGRWPALFEGTHYKPEFTAVQRLCGWLLENSCSTVVTPVFWDFKKRWTLSLETLRTTWNISWIAFHTFERWRN